MTTSVLPPALLPPPSSPISGAPSVAPRRPLTAPRRGSRTCTSSDCQNDLDNHFNAHCSECRARRRVEKTKASRASTKAEEPSGGVKLMQQARAARKKLEQPNGCIDGETANIFISGGPVASSSKSKPHTSKVPKVTPSTAHRALLTQSARLRKLSLSDVPAGQLQAVTATLPPITSAILASTRAAPPSSSIMAPAVAPPTKKQRLADGSVSVSSRTHDRVRNRTVPSPKTSVTPLAASAGAPKPFPLSAAFMAPSSPISDEDDEMASLFQSSSSRQPLVVSNKGIRLTTVSIPVIPIPSTSTSRPSSPILLSEPTHSFVHTASSPAPGLKPCTTCRSHFDAGEKFNTCPACRTIARAKWAARAQKKRQSVLPAGSSPAPSDDKDSVVPPEESISTAAPSEAPGDPTAAEMKQCTTCHGAMPASEKFKQCGRCRERGRESARRFTERKRQSKLALTDDTAKDDDDVVAILGAGAEQAYQTMTALHDALARVRRKKLPAQFAGTHSAVADPQVRAAKRLEHTQRDLRKLVKLRFGEMLAKGATATHATAKYACACKRGDTDACQGSIEIAVEIDEKAHPFLVAERTTIKITH